MASSRQMSENRQITTPVRSRLLMPGLQLRVRGDGFGEGGESNGVQVDVGGLLMRVEFLYERYDDRFKVPSGS
jgi:hypothetical protein